MIDPHHTAIRKVSPHLGSPVPNQALQAPASSARFVQDGGKRARAGGDPCLPFIAVPVCSLGVQCGD